MGRHVQTQVVHVAKPGNFGTRLHGGCGWNQETHECKYRMGDGIASVETGDVLKTRQDLHP